MRAVAGLTVTRGPTGLARSRITRLRSDPPLILRPTGVARDEPLRRWNLGNPSTLRVALAAGAAGPVGGDDLRLNVEVDTGATLVLRGVAATLALPGPHREPSHSQMTVRVAADATLVWWPGPLIAARGCDHRATTRILIEPGGRLVAREELILGRHGEQPGSIRQRLRVTLGDRVLHDQELRLGAGAPGWDGPAVVGGRRAVGSVLIIDPSSPCVPAALPDADTARLPLCGPGVLLTALAGDAVTLRRRLDTALDGIEEPLQVPGPTEVRR